MNASEPGSFPLQGLSFRGARSLTFGTTPLVMGILNVTPDSFSDGGVHFEKERAIEAALRMESDGADLVDVGGESTRPGAQPVSAAEELDRVLAVIEGIRARSAIVVSIDTRRAVVAGAALEAGADLVNDVSALRFDPGMAEVVAAAQSPVILMHMRGDPQTMQGLTQYDDVVRDVAAELEALVARAVARGVRRDAMMVDPGIGFAKTFEQNLAILARCHELKSIAPVVIGASRKAFLGVLTGRAAGSERIAGSLAAAGAALVGGAAMVRVHDVAATVDFLRVSDAIGGMR